VVAYRSYEEDDKRDIEIMENLFKHSARSLIDRDIVLEHAGSTVDNPHRIKVFRDGLVEYFNANEFELFKKKS